MQIVKNLKENTSHKLTGAGAYEWWYFDCIDEDNEYSFTAKFITGNPFSVKYTESVKEHLNFPELKKPGMADFCALSFSLYFKNRIVYNINYDYARNDFRVESESGNEKVSLEKNSFNFVKNENKYYLNINLSTLDLDRKFKAEFVFTVVNDTSSQETDKDEIPVQDEKHFWLPAASVCQVSGKFKFYVNFKRMKTEFNGFGYHDHHWGDEALFINIDSWYWGRVISENYSFIYFYIQYCDNTKKPFKKLVIYKNGRVEKELDEFNVKLNKKFNFSSLSFSKDIVISADGVKLICNNKTNLEEGHSFTRYLSLFELLLNGKSVLTNNTGISEYIIPKKFKIDP